jgi:hypothetical protein
MTTPTIADRVAGLRDAVDFIPRLIAIVTGLADDRQRPFEAHDPHRSLLKLIESADRDPVLVAAFLTDLPDPAQRLVLRMTEPDMLWAPGLQPRRSVDTDPAAYLAHGINSYVILRMILDGPEIAELPGLRDLILDPGLDDAERVTRILALHPRAADLCSYYCANGPALDDTARFYTHVIVPGSAPIWEVVDRETNATMILHKSEDEAHTHAKLLNAFPEIAGRLARCYLRGEELDLRDHAGAHRLELKGASLLEELRLASAA